MYCFLFNLYIVHAKGLIEWLSQDLQFDLMDSEWTSLYSLSTLWFYGSISNSLRPYYLGLEKSKFQLRLWVVLISKTELFSVFRDFVE